ncbi:MAG: deoxyribonuclease V [Phototrophicales bacterium]|nr:MAG: deoxyribonuclease V [Phototrophicales bacterium]
MHAWNLSVSEAIALQKTLAKTIDTQTPIPLESIQYVAGVDVSVKNEISRAAIVVFEYPTLRQVEVAYESIPTPFPYIAGLLTFREGEVILKAHEKLKLQPDVYIFDGHGIYHPRRLGIASHMGLWLQKPTIGCGKTHFIGTYGEVGPKKGDTTPIFDGEEVIGMLVRTRDRVKPVYVSVGHLATLETAVELVFRCTTRYRLPEPTRIADQLAGKFSP